VAITYLTGFEGQAVGVDGIVTTTGTVAYSTAQKRTGAASLRINPATSANGYASFVSASFAGYVNFGFYVATLPIGERIIYGSNSSTYINATINSAGRIYLYEGATNIGSSSTLLTTNTWYWIGIRNIPGTSVVFLTINGKDEITGTATTASATGYLGCSDSTANGAIDFYYDDLIIDDTGFLEPSKVGLLLPISDNARSTLWTGGSGGTTNLYDAVNNTPPVGSATESNTTQIEHAGGAAGTTDLYAADMTTYTTAGVNAGDSVIALQGIVSWGEDISTGTKLLSYSGVSNPSWTGESSIDVSTGHGSGAVTTFSTGTDYWNERRSAIVTNPSVTLGTSPVMKVTRPETASRVASVCFMGMYVAWTPAAAAGSFPYVGGGYYP